MKRKTYMIGALVALGLLVSGAAANDKWFDDTPKHQIRYDYRVKSGDTLWDIAAKNAPDDMDIREYLHNLYQINGADVVNLRPGQVITLYRY